MTAPARLVSMHTHPETLTLIFVTRGTEIHVSCGIEGATIHTLRHLHALHAHPACGAASRTPIHVDLLLRAVQRLGATQATVLVRPGPQPAFWLRLSGVDGPGELDLDLVDAVALLMSQRLPVELVDAACTDWDEALADLLSDPPGNGPDRAL